MTRADRERRAYRLTVLGAVSATLGVIGLVLSAVGVGSAGIPIVLLVIAAVCVVLFRRTVGR